jgi:hypothetical protein
LEEIARDLFRGHQLFNLMEKYNLKAIEMGEIAINNHAETEDSTLISRNL